MTKTDHYNKKRWLITRWVVEKMEVTAETREEAMDSPEDPFAVLIAKETCVELFD